MTKTAYIIKSKRDWYSDLPEETIGVAVTLDAATEAVEFLTNKAQYLFNLRVTVPFEDLYIEKVEEFNTKHGTFLTKDEYNQVRLGGPLLYDYEEVVLFEKKEEEEKE